MIKINSPKASVSKWFASFYFIFCILFGFLLVPIIKYSEGVCRELVTEKFNQKLISASTKFDDELYAVSIIPEELVSYSDFIPYIYQKDDYMHADYKFQKQIRNIMINKFHITSMAKDFALQFNVNEVITESQIFLLQSLQYYPKFFEVDEMSANEWHSYLLQFQEQTLTFHHIKSSKGEYDALVYIVPCISDIYAQFRTVQCAVGGQNICRKRLRNLPQNGTAGRHYRPCIRIGGEDGRAHFLPDLGNGGFAAAGWAGQPDNSVFFRQV